MTEMQQTNGYMKVYRHAGGLMVTAIFAVFLLYAVVPAATITFRETAGKNIRNISTRIDATPTGFVVESVDTAYTVKTIVGKDFLSTSWHFTSAKENMELSAEKTGKGIHVSGHLKNKKIDKVIDPNGSHWWQEATLPMGQWALKGEKVIRPCSISMMNGDLVVFEITNKGDEVVNIDGRTTPCFHLRMGLTGIMAMVWHGDYWFRKTDGRMIRYQGSGVPGYPPMSYELVGENE